jgi:hypothetical protein
MVLRGIAITLAAISTACGGATDESDGDGGVGGSGHAGSPATGGSFSSGGSSGAGGTPGTGGRCVSDGMGGSTFTGDISVFTDESLSGVVRYGGIAELRGEGFGGCDTVATYDGTQAAQPSFVLSGLLPEDLNWIETRQTGGTPPVVPGIMALLTTADVTLYGANASGPWMTYVMAPVSVMDAIFTSVGLSRDPARAQVLVAVEGQTGRQVGVTVDIAAGTMAYYDGNWSTSLTSTSAHGIAAALNVAVASEGGELQTVTLGDTQQESVFVKPGYVTIATLMFGT